MPTLNRSRPHHANNHDISCNDSRPSSKRSDEKRQYRILEFGKEARHAKHDFECYHYPQHTKVAAASEAPICQHEQAHVFYIARLI